MTDDRDYDALAADIAKSEGNGDLAHALHQLSQVKAKLAEADERIAWLDCGFEQAMADTRAAEARIAHLENHIEAVAKDTHKIMVDLATPMRCAECDCEKGGADCNWIATPAPAVDDPQAAMDNDAVYRFSRLMQDKMAKSRAKGRSGWNDPKQCSPDYLRALLYEHIYKGDPVDVANICMMLGHYQETTQPRAKDDLRLLLTPADPLNDPRVKALVEAAREVKADCIARADKHGVVPIGRGAWDQLTAALSALEENK